MAKSQADEEERPPERDNYFTVPMDDEMLERGVKRAGSPSKLRAVIRAFVYLWGIHEYPTPPEDVVEQQGRRAKKRSR